MEQVMMKLHPSKLAIATAAVFAVTWVICSIIVASLPGPMMALSGYMMHAERGNMAWSMGFGGLVVGLILWTVLPALIVFAIASLYNRLID